VLYFPSYISAFFFKKVNVVRRSLVLKFG